MIVGLITIVTLIVMTFLGTRSVETETPAFTDRLILPEGQQARAYTQGTDWSAVVTRDTDGTERIHIFDPDTGVIRQTVEIVAE